MTNPDATNAWIDEGINNGYCTPATCIQHDGTPFTDLEAEAFERGDDPCILVFRIIDTNQHPHG